MSEFLEKTKAALAEWLTHYVATVVHTGGGDGSIDNADARGHVRDLGSLALEIYDVAPGRIPVLAELVDKNDTFAAGQMVLATVLGPDLVEAPLAARDFLIEAAGAVAEQVAAAEEEGAAAAEGAEPSESETALETNPEPTPTAPPAVDPTPTPAAGTPGPIVTGPVIEEATPVTPVGSEPSTPPASTPEPVFEAEPPEWYMSLWLTRVHCVQETDGAGQDEFMVLGNYRYDEQFGSTRVYEGSFDSGNVKSLKYKKTLQGGHEVVEPNGFYLCKIKVVHSTEFRPFNITLSALEDDGMSASKAKTLANIIGGLATLGVNAIMGSASVGGTQIPAAAKDAYTNLGLPALVGTLAKAFGPEPFMPIDIRARISWPRNAPNAPPKWTAMIPFPGGKRGPHIGEDKHEGSVTFLEAELKEVPNGNGEDIYTLVAQGDEGKYYAYFALIMQKG